MVTCLLEYAHLSLASMDIRPRKSHNFGLIIGTIVFITAAVTKTKQQDTFYFDPAPIDQNVVEGDDVLLQCDVSNRRHIQFVWEENDRPLQETSRRFQEDSDLRILRVNREHDSNPFRCTATNVSTGVSLRSREARLDILWIAKEAKAELKQPKESELAEGVDVTVKCEVDGNSSPDIEWFKNNERLFRSEKHKYLRNGKLKIIGVTVQDNGVYSCKAQNLAGTVESKDNFLLNLQGQEAAHLDTETFTRYTLSRQGDQARLDCRYEGALMTEWFYGETRLTNHSQADKYTIHDSGDLVIRNLQTEDAGSYKCVGHSENGPDQIFVSELQIAYLGEFTPESFQPKPQPERPLVVSKGKTIEVLCVPPTGLPEPTQRWQSKWGTEVGESGRILSQDGVLTLSDAQPDDSGNYTCLADNMAGQARNNVWIVVSVAPSWKQPPLSDRVNEGGRVTLNCQYQGTPYPVTSIAWKKGEFPVDVSHPRFDVDQESMTLTISDVHLIDEDDYVCVVNTTGHPLLVSPNAHLYVEKRLKFRPAMLSERLELGTRTEVECHADARTVPTVHWKREDGQPFPDHVTDVDGLLVFNGVKYSDAGNYTCVAQTETERINATIPITVGVKPKFVTRPKNTTAYEGYPAILHCRAEGVPTPKIEWDKNNVLRGFSGDRFKELSNGSLYIVEVYMDDVGKYGCMAGNSGGFDREEVYLHVARADGKSPGMFHPEDGFKADNFNMMKTIIIAVCSAIAYLAIVIGLTVYCSLRMMRAKNQRKQRTAGEVALTACPVEKVENGALPNEQTELMDKKDRDASSIVKGGGGHGDLDARSHISGVSSHPSQAQSHSSQSQGSRSRTMDKLAFPRHQLQTLGMLGKGQYGDVFLAKAHQIREGEPETLVVIKSLLSRDDTHQHDFRREIDMFSKLSHENIAKLLGICCDMEPRFLITEYSDWGDLKQYLWATRKDNGRRLRPLTSAQKTSMCSQVAMAMEHLSNNRFVHRDLAARNVLLSSSLDLKVSCLGLCRDVYATEYFPFHQQLIPLRWMPPEAALEDDYSNKSDVWAFGVFMWEVFTLGDLPHRTRADDEILKCFKAGEQLQLEQPLDFPPEIYQLVLKCTAESPKDRPTFSHLVLEIGDIHVDSDV